MFLEFELSFCLFVVVATAVSIPISIPGCVEFPLRLNACRGFCVSYSVPSGEETRFFNPSQVITSVGQCCNIMETEDVSIYVIVDPLLPLTVDDLSSACIVVA